jgi:hypothetical protein
MGSEGMGVDLVRERMTMTKPFAALGCSLALAAGLVSEGRAQRPLADAGAQQAGTAQTANAVPHRTRLILKDGSYQVVMSYQVKGKIVSYVSAERDATEEIPAELIDWDATHKWERQHLATESVDAGQGLAVAATPNPAIDPELLKEEADRAAWTPEVAPDLRLPELDSVLALDTFHGAPELVPLVQSEGELNRTTGHNILKLAINPRSASHQIEQLKGVEAAVQLHVETPAIYVRLGDDSGVMRGGTPLTVDTHGAVAGGKMDASGGASSGGSADSGYVMVRADVRTDTRVLASFNIGVLGGGVKQQEDVIEMASEVLPGGHWMKLTPKRPLDFGEYALMEVVSENEINLGVWDFGVHPVAPENRDAIKPEPKRPVTLERREQ